MSFQQHILQLQKTYGEHDAQRHIVFGLTDIYDLLMDNQVLQISAKRSLPSPNIASNKANGNETTKLDTRISNNT